MDRIFLALLGACALIGAGLVTDAPDSGAPSPATYAVSYTHLTLPTKRIV